MVDSGTYIFAFQIENEDQFVDIFGSEVSRIVWEDLIFEFTGICQELLQRYYILTEVICPFVGRCYVLFSINPSDILIDMEEQTGVLATAASQKIREILEKNLGNSTGSRVNFKIVTSRFDENLNDLPRLNQKLDLLFRSSALNSFPRAQISQEQFKKIIDDKSIEIFYQSIVSLPDEKIVGYEALTRGTGNELLFNADILFGTAAYCNYTKELELLSFEKALEWFPRVPKEYFVTINIGPEALTTSLFWEILLRKEFSPYLSRLIIELTEHLPIKKSSGLRDIRERLKSYGVRLSLDDTGCGFFDLNTVENLRPEIVKLCITVISRIGRSLNISRDITETVAQISKFGAFVLGEGVERRDQLEVLNECGVRYAQGNYFDKPVSAQSLFKQN